MIKLVLQYLTAAILLAVACWQFLQIVRHPRDAPLRAMAVGLLCVGVDATVNIAGSPVRAELVRVLGTSYPTLTNGLWTVTAFCFAVFFLLADRSARHARVVALLFALLVLNLALAASLPGLLPHPPELKGVVDFRSWVTVLRYAPLTFTNLLYWVIGLVGAVRYLGGLTHAWLRWSVGLVILGALGMALVDATDVVKYVLRAVEDVHHYKRYPFTSATYLVGLLGGQSALALGFVLPLIGAIVNMIRRRVERLIQRRYRARTDYLWSTLTMAFPHIVLSAETPSEEMAFIRRTAEITDALAELGPYYPAAGLHPAPEGLGLAEPNQAARIIDRALDLYARDSDPAEAPFLRLEPDHRHWIGQARWMAQVSEALEAIRLSSRLGAAVDA